MNQPALHQDSLAVLEELGRSTLQGLKVHAKVTTHNDLLSAGGALLNEVQAQITASSQVENLDLNIVLKHLRSFSQAIKDFVTATNNTEKPSPSRDINLGADLLHYAITAWGNSSIDQNTAIIRAIYANSQSDGTIGEVSNMAPEYILGSLPLFTVNESGKNFPIADVYCKLSTQSGDAYRKLDARRNEITTRLNKLLENPKAEEQYKDVLPGLRTEIATTGQEIYKLALQISDVDINDVKAALGATEIKISLKQNVINELITATRSFESFITEVANYKEDTQKAASLDIPLFDGTQVTLIKFDLGQYLGTIKDNPSMLAEMVDTYEELRSTIKFALSTGKYNSGIKEALGALEQGFTVKSTTANLLAISSTELNLSLAQHYASPIILNSKPGFVLENIDNQLILSWAIKNYLYANSDSQEFKDFDKLLNCSSDVSKKVGVICKRAHQLLHEKDFENLAKLVNHDIVSSENSDDNLIRVTTLTLLQSLCEHPEASRVLRHQIPDLEKLTIIAERLNRAHPPIGIVTSSMVSKAFKTLQSSLANFHTDREQLQELWDCIDTYRFFLENQQIVRGIAGNEIMKSGLLLVGPPGAGKTHLANSLRIELGLEMFEVSPTKKKLGVNETMLDVARREIDNAKKLNKPCILFIDEAEAIAMERSNPKITQQQHDLTDYVLQEIDEIRRKHPQIFLMGATNYGDKIDEAMTRNGRFDYVIYMDNPTIEVRKNIIKGTILEHKLPIILTDEQITELATMADGFMPLALKRPLIELVKVKIPMGRAKDASFESVKTCFEDEVRRLKIRQERQKRKLETSQSSETTEAVMH